MALPFNVIQDTKTNVESFPSIGSSVRIILLVPMHTVLQICAGIPYTKNSKYSEPQREALRFSKRPVLYSTVLVAAL